MWIERELKLRGVESELPKLDWVHYSILLQYMHVKELLCEEKIVTIHIYSECK